MLRLLQFLIFGHVHKWKTLDVVDLEDRGAGVTGQRHYQQCLGCGVVVKRDLI